jgi:hypothetical protein
MGSRRFGGVRFVVYPGDHQPRHLHAFVGDGEVIVELRCDGTVSLADRTDAARGVKENEVRKVLDLAARHFAELELPWESMHV